MLTAIGAAVLSLATGLMQTATEIAEQAKEAALVAHRIQLLTELSETSVLGYSFCGGLIGAVAGWAFRMIPKDGIEAGRAVLGSCLMAFIFGPRLMYEIEYAPNLTNVLCVSGGIGVCAWFVVVKIFPRLAPLLINLSPAWLLRILQIKTGVDFSPYDMANGRAHSDPQKTEKLTAPGGLNTPPARRPRKPYLDDDGSNAP